MLHNPGRDVRVDRYCLHAADPHQGAFTPGGQTAPQPWRGPGGLRSSVRALAREARCRPSRLLLVVAVGITCASFASYILFGLIALGLISIMVTPFAKYYGRGNEEHLNRRSSRPPFEDESCRSSR